MQIEIDIVKAIKQREEKFSREQVTIQEQLNLKNAAVEARKAEITSLLVEVGVDVSAITWSEKEINFGERLSFCLDIMGVQIKCYTVAMLLWVRSKRECAWRNPENRAIEYRTCNYGGLASTSDDTRKAIIDCVATEKAIANGWN